MSRQILIVDAVATNRIVLKVKLAAAFYDVAQAVTAREALDMVRRNPPALIVLGGLHDIPAVEFCARLRRLPATAYCPIVVLTSPTGADLRLAALEAGASCLLEQPYCDALLLARIRSLMRGQDTETELRMREGTHRALGLAEPKPAFEVPGRIGVIAEDRRAIAGRVAALKAAMPHRVDLMAPRDVLRGEQRTRDRTPAPDVLVIALDEGQPEAALKILPDLRARMATRFAGVLMLVPDAAGTTAATALDLGADDVAARDISPAEMALRTERLLIRKRMADRLRSTVREGLRAAVTDPLTGLFNRRYALPHVARIADRSARLGRPFAVMVADLDHFKQINDRYGHAAGDAVLAEVANRLRQNLRPVDLVARIGGEEFLIALPDATPEVARITAHRLRRAMADTPFDIPGHDQPVPITVSIGVTMAGVPKARALCAKTARALPDLRPEVLLRRADAALYEAKAHGRNQVELGRPAA
ncbi:MAG: diguanylate cyclase [Rhodobacteraceae bacterium]|nr:MAG: diguanylate cyclase [Paracoccaceae bacterium]